MPVSPYVTRLREHIGHDLLLLPGASAVVRDERGRILLQRRSDNGRWSLPAGMIDPGEQPAAAAVREIFEETGIRAEVERLGGVAMHRAEYPNGDRCEYLNVWFRCRPVGGEVRADGDESLEVGWFAPADLPGLDEWALLRIETTAAPDGPPWFAGPGDVVPHPALYRATHFDLRLAPIGLLWKPIGMTTGAVPAGDDPRRLLAEVRALAHRVRVDQRMTWAALLVLGAMTLLAIPFDWFGMVVHCFPDGGCSFARRGMLYYWPAAMVLAYATIAVCYLRAARARGLGTRVLPYAITGAVTTVVFPAAWLAVNLYFRSHPYPDPPLPYWYFVLDRLVMPWGMIGVTLLVLAWLERNTGLLLFTAGYLALVLLVLPMSDGFGPPHFGLRAGLAAPQLIAGLVLVLGAAGFARAERRRRPTP